eukprot:CAMPEP_0181357728 /NCGR_PEP_ID=MMETSP1106-20121128/5121_1 /TAXON_ID=81844 /ORGANISM="Mantoniella antarctica, Strain SL-175" /LENGTH=209 /DNA_ID=CAMNT_0023470621 /DNA_START=662 /DNA_END=1291 /DNA_ORIENTATION=-
MPDPGGERLEHLGGERQRAVPQDVVHIQAVVDYWFTICTAAAGGFLDTSLVLLTHVGTIVPLRPPPSLRSMSLRLDGSEACAFVGGISRHSTEYLVPTTASDCPPSRLSSAFRNNRVLDSTPSCIESTMTMRPSAASADSATFSPSLRNLCSRLVAQQNSVTMAPTGVPSMMKSQSSLGFRVHSLGFRVWSLGFRPDLGCRVWSLEIRV